MMLFQQVIRAVIDPEILIDPLALNVSIISIEINHRIVKILYRNAISAKSAPAAGVYLLQPGKILLIQDKRLKLVPNTLQVNLHPAVKNIFRCIFVYDTSHCASLQFFIDREPMYPAGNPHAAQQRHKKGSFCIALPISIRQNSRRRNTVIHVVSK